MDPSQFNPVTTEILNYQQDRAEKIAEDVDGETEKQLRASLSQGIDNNESDHQLVARIEGVMGAALTYRTARIVKTEVARAQGFADITAWQQSGMVTGKVWTTGSANPCQYCSALDGKVVALGDNFLSLGDVLQGTNGGSMNVSYDDVPSCPAHPNCGCAITPVMA